MNEPIWKAPAFPLLPLTEAYSFLRVFSVQYSPGVPKALDLSSPSLFPLNTQGGFLCPSVMLEGDGRRSHSLSCASLIAQCLARRLTQRRDLFHCPNEWESRAGTSNVTLRAATPNHTLSHDLHQSTMGKDSETEGAGWGERRPQSQINMFANTCPTTS